MIQFAVIGVGRMGSRHAFNIRYTLPGIKLAAVCDLDENKLEKYRKKSIAVFTDWHEMLKKTNVDCVVIAVPHYAHEEVAAGCLAHGVHTLVEKPVTVTVGAAERLMQTAEQSTALFGVMYNQRTNPLYHRAKELIESGKIGEIVRANFIITDWYRSQAYYNHGGWRASWSGEGGGTLINQCVHQLDILQWLIGLPETIFSDCKCVGRQITTENDVTALFKYPTFNCVFTASAHELHGTNRLEIAGTKGKILILKNKMQVTLLKESEPEVNARTVRGYGNTGAKNLRYSYGIRNLRDTILGQQRNIIKNFAKAAAANDADRLIAPGAEGIRALSLVNGIYLSAWRGEEVALPLDAEAYEQALEERRLQE